MKINDYIIINPGLEVYQTVYSALGAAIFAAAATATAENSKGLGYIQEFSANNKWVRIKWLKETYIWGLWYDFKQTKQSFSISPIPNILYKKVNNE